MEPLLYKQSPVRCCAECVASRQVKWLLPLECHSKGKSKHPESSLKFPWHARFSTSMKELAAIKCH